LTRQDIAGGVTKIIKKSIEIQVTDNGHNYPVPLIRPYSHSHSHSYPWKCKMSYIVLHNFEKWLLEVQQEQWKLLIRSINIHHN